MPKVPRLQRQKNSHRFGGISFKSGTGILPVNHAQDARATIKTTRSHRFGGCFVFWTSTIIARLNQPRREKELLEMKELAKWRSRHCRLAYQSFAVGLVLAGCLGHAAAQADRRIERIERLARQTNEQIAESERVEESNGIYCNELVVNKGDKSWPAVGIYRTVVKFYYTFGDREQNPYPNRLLKITVTTKRSDRQEYAEYVFNPAEQLIFYHQKQGETARSESSYYFASGRPIRRMSGQRLVALNSREAKETATLALQESRRLREVFLKSLE